MAIVAVSITKSKGTVSIDTDKVPQHVYEAALLEGLKVLVNKGMSKITAKDIPDEDTRKAEAQLIGEKNAAAILDGTIKLGRASTASTAKVSGAVKTEAMRLARNVIKGEMKKAGIKVSHVAAKDITAAAKELLEQDTEGGLLKEAEANLKARAEAPVKIDIKSLVKVSPELVAKAEERKAKAKKDAPASAAQAGKVATRKKGQQATA